jgi:hypothetical protein
MRKFTETYKEKQQVFENLQETKILKDFKNIYNVMLESYSVNSIHKLDDPIKLAFLTELNRYWSEDDGLSDKGKDFLKKKSYVLTENSTPLQKKNFLKNKFVPVLNETFRQTDVKYKLYEIIDSMLKQVKGTTVSDVLSPEMITNIITEAFNESAKSLIANINEELTESDKKEEKINESASKVKVFRKK